MFRAVLVPLGADRAGAAPSRTVVDPMHPVFDILGRVCVPVTAAQAVKGVHILILVHCPYIEVLVARQSQLLREPPTTVGIWNLFL